jgi:hypothetical protein
MEPTPLTVVKRVANEPSLVPCEGHAVAATSDGDRRPVFKECSRRATLLVDHP